MKEYFIMETTEQLKAFSHPIRYQMLKILALKSMTGAQLARALKMPRQRLHYHLKILRSVGLIVQVDGPADQGVVEKYYRSIAENYSSPFLQNLVSQEEMDPPQREYRSHSIRELSFAFLEQVKNDLQQPDTIQKISHLNPPFQYLVFLTPEQERETHERFQAIKNDIIQHSEENIAGKTPEELLGIRYTLLVTPSFTGEQEA